MQNEPYNAITNYYMCPTLAHVGHRTHMYYFCWNVVKESTSLWWVKWLLEIVIAVEPMTASTRPSAQWERELWSTQIWLEPNIETASPSAIVLQPKCVSELLTIALPVGLQSWIWRPWMITLVTYWIVMHPPLAICTLAPLPSMVLKLFTISSCLNWITMSLLNTIQSGLSWMTAWRKVPGLGLTGSSSLGSVTT